MQATPRPVAMKTAVFRAGKMPVSDAMRYHWGWSTQSVTKSIFSMPLPAFPNKSAIFIPDINKWSEWQTDLAELIKSVDYALIDATFYADGELPGRDMSKVPHPFVTESMELLDHLSVKERNKVWFIHMNHTNPLLDVDSKESKAVQSRGFNVAVEGIKLNL